MIKIKKITSKLIGDQAERIACHYLQQQGCQLIDKNFHCRFGEIDLIMQDGPYLVFIEVRYRQHSHYGTPLETITKQKQQKLQRSIQYYLQKWKHAPLLRIDVLGLEGHLQNPKIHWCKNVSLCGEL